MHPTNTNVATRTDLRLIRCPDCGQMEWWTEEECADHGKCRASAAPCPVCPDTGPLMPGQD
jgi:hypothetical protein